MDVTQSMGSENGFDRMSGDEELGEEKLAQTSNGQKRSRHEFEVDSDDGQYESGEMPTNGNGKDAVNYLFLIILFNIIFLFSFYRIKQVIIMMKWMKKKQIVYVVV
jgi:hypothetical protein